MNKDLYTLLQVDPYSEPAAIEAAYRSLAQQLDPSADPSPAAAVRLRAVEAAYTVLKDPQQRETYDFQFGWKVNTPPEPAAGATPAHPAGTAAGGERRMPPRFAEIRRGSGLTRCDGCGLPAQTHRVHFQQNIGALFRRFYREVDGDYCQDCIERHFWTMTGKTLLLGWWGIISFCVTPWILIGNVIAYLKVPKPPRSPSAAPLYSTPWKDFVISIGLLVIIGIGLLIVQNI